MSYDLLVFIGRFQPFHNGHLAVVRHALDHGDQVLVLAGSAFRPRSTRDPFTADERAAMIAACLPPPARARVHVVPLSDAMYNDALWLRNVHAAVLDCIGTRFPDREASTLRIGLVGHSKDHTSYYLRLFPTWGAVNVGNHDGVNATDLRLRYLRGDAQHDPVLAAHLPPPVLAQLQRFATTTEYAELVAEQAFVLKYQSQFAGLKYPPTFNTADSLVLQSGHLLLVRRGARPGLGLLALPGGFIEHDETALDAAIRELREETRLKVPEPVLRGSLVARDLFDDPHRSARGRTFTAAFRFDLRPDTALPKIKGGDDAREALWMPLARIRPQEMFEDHYFIIQKMIGL